MDEKDYYNFHWKQKGGTLKDDPYMIEKIKLIMNSIPSDVKSILDIGCGDGAITNVFIDKYNVTAIDISSEAIKHLSSKIKAIVGNCSSIPLSRNYADLVFSSELMEHLPSNEVLLKTISEMKRLTRKYIFVSVPNNEDLRKRFTKCYSCGSEFHIYRHYRRINLNKLKKYFNDYRVKYKTVCGVPDPPSFYIISYLKIKLAKAYFYITSMKMICPTCGDTLTYSKRNFFQNVSYYFLYIIQKIFIILINKKPEPDWLIVLFEKE